MPRRGASRLAAQPSPAAARGFGCDAWRAARSLNLTQNRGTTPDERIALPQSPTRPELIQRLRTTPRWDLVVIGGGATGLGVALDAAARGFTVALVEAEDFAKGTSSRATKLVHGGVRYLAQGNVALVHEALRERATLLHNAPHLAQPLAFVMPCHRAWETPFYGIGLKAYQWLAGRRSLGATRLLSASEALAQLPGLQADGLRGGVSYWDAQFDDARLATTLARTAIARGAAVLNHCAAVRLVHEGERVTGVEVQERESGEQFTLHAACVINAAGVWVDAVRELDRRYKRPMVAPSQGVHLVVDRDFLPGAGGHHKALIVPRTRDGRVLFAVPWLGKTLLGTTDTPREDLPAEPTPLAGEIEFILGEAGRYLARAPQRADVRSIWAGLRPLVRHKGDHEDDTKTISREHVVAVSRSGMVTVTGGKWTTYRAMAEDVLARCFKAGLLPARRGGVTEHLPLLGADGPRAVAIAAPPGAHLYGSEAAQLQSLPGADRWLWRDGDGGLSEAMVRFAVRFEMARTLEDVLARRSRLLFLDAREAERLAEPVAAIVGEELGRPIDAAQLSAFRQLAQQYQLRP